MDTFWTWLMRANARVLLATALVALALVTAWWTWQEFQPVDTLAPIPPGADRERPGLPLGMLALLQRQIDEGAPVPNNLFLISSGPRTVVPVKRPPRTLWLPTPKPKPPTPKDPPPLPPKPKETVRLTYHGLFTRPDGRTLALIEDAKTKSRRFYQPGDTLHGMTIETANFASLALKDAGDNSILMPLGKPQRFEDGHHAP